MSKFMCGPKGLKLEYCFPGQAPPGSRLKGATSATGEMGEWGETGAERSG